MDRKKVLIVTYNWPPSGGISVLRCLKIAKYLRNFGWEPIVYTAKNPQYPYFDTSNEKDIPEGLTVIKRPIVEPFGLFQKLSRRKKDVPVTNITQVREKRSLMDNIGIYIRGNYFIPDARSLWIAPSVKFLSNYLNQNPVDAIFTDGPPHTNTVIGCELAKATGIPWMADFQDPWTQVDYYSLFKIGKRADRKHKRLEQETFFTARKITIASPSWKSDLEDIGAKNVEVLYYGYDEDDFSDIEVKADEYFTLCHSGLLGFDRSPDNLFKAVQALKGELPTFAEKVKIKLLGEVDFTVMELAEKFGVRENIVTLGRVSREQSLVEVVNAWVLLLPLNKANNVNGRMPGKFYEYIRTGRPIVSFGPEGTDVSKVVADYGLGANFEYDNAAELKNYLKDIYQKQYLSKKFESVAYKKDRSFFSNFNQTRVVAKCLDEITGNE